MLNSTAKNLVVTTVASLYLIGCGGGGGGGGTTSLAETPTSNPSVTLSSDVVAAQINSNVRLNWTSSGMESCEASGDWTGSKSTSGTETISSISSDSTFVLTCTGANGEMSDTLNVSVAPPGSPTTTLSASPDSVTANGSTTLSWSSTDASSCTASGDWSGTKATSGSETITAITDDSVFNLSCSGTAGSASDSVNVTVIVPNNNGSALLSWTPPTQNTDGSALTDLDGYRIRYGTAPGSYSNNITIGSGLSSYQVDGLATDTWYFVVTSFNVAGIESSYSTVVSKTIN